MTTLPAIPSRSQVDATLNFEKIQKLLNPSWTKLTLVSALGFNSGTYEPAVRVLPGEVVELRGLLLAKAGKEVAAGGAICTLPLAYCPSKSVVLTTQVLEVALTFILVEASGAVTIGHAIKEGGQVPLDGLVYSIS